jgi:hypothetical protein
MLRKTISGPVSFKADGQTGEFSAVFSRFNVKDADGDVTYPDAFSDGEEARVSAWGHGWDQLPVGKGVIHFDGAQAWLDGRFFLETAAGREHYETVKALGPLQEWSYGYKVLDAAPGVFEGESVRYLKRLQVIEVSPVMQGAGVGTHTAAIKSAEPKERKALDFQAILVREQTERDLWETRWQLERAMSESVESVLQDPTLDQQGKLALIQQSGAQYTQALVGWATRAILAGFGQDEKGLEASRTKALEHHGGEGAKEGRRNSNSDLGRLQQIHDLTAELGAKCLEAMAAQTVPPSTGEAGDEASPSGASPKARNPQETRERLAARVALELLDLGVSDSHTD